jgi:tRNA/tmRNA/rRNA uracil-C5-methylase (TrmA/RlmC/RlmD family)
VTSPLPTLTIERVVSGGHGLARHEGRVVLVRGAITGEVVHARVQRTGKGGVVFAEVADVVEASPDRIEPVGDPRCGGLAFAHVRYARQLVLKREMLVDALRRTGGVTDPPAVDVMASPQQDWRLRARLHVADGRVGFYREGTHTLCAPPVSQLPPNMVAAAQALVDALPSPVRAGISDLVVARSLASGDVAMHVDLHDRARVAAWQGPLPAGIVGLTVARAGRREIGQVIGHPVFEEPWSAVSGREVAGTLRWQPAAFFQANRYVLPFLVQRVLDALDDGPIVDLFAGVGLFGLGAAAVGHRNVTCVEGDDISGAMLRMNAETMPVQVAVRRTSVEAFVTEAQARLDGATVIVDPPRTGLPTRVREALCLASAARIVYVSCDAPTFARDLRRLREAGYTLCALQAFDMFPLTAHLETLAVLERDGGHAPA